MAGGDLAVKRRGRSPIWMQVGCLNVVVAAFAFAMLCVGVESLGMLASGPGVFVVATALATVFTVPYVLLVLWLDRNEPEPVWLLGLTFLWGALVATSLAGLFNTLFGLVAGAALPPVLAQQAMASFSAPPVEEGFKAFALFGVVLVFRREFDNVLDGVVYGAVIGLGFAWFENITYYVMVADGGGPMDMLKLAYVRGFLNGVGSHAAYTGMTGLGFGLWRVMRRGTLRWFMPPAFLLLAMFAHFCWNTFAIIPAVALGGTEWTEYLVAYPIATVVLQVPFLILIALVVLVAWRHEDRLITKYLDDEGADVYAHDMRGHMVPARRRFFAGLGRVVRGGPVVWWRYRRLERHLIKLAFLKWHHARDQVDWTPDQDADVRALRVKARGYVRALAGGGA